jgi:hypothetical protein
MKTRSKTGTLKTVRKPIYYDSEESQDYDISPDSENPDLKSNRRRFRKNEIQVKVLIQEFDKNRFWSKKLVLELSAKTGLTESQVYKWNWDYRKKIRKSEKLPTENKFSCKETLMPGRLESEIMQLQKFYKVSFNAMPITTPSRFLFSGM